MRLLSKGTKLYSILHSRCPRCHQGKMFLSKPYNMKHFFEMPEKCDHCGRRFELEPSFYSGAMYVSYALQVALFTTVFVALRVLFNPGVRVYISTTIVSAMLLFPLTMRLSRVIYLNFFVKYDRRFD